MYELHHLKGNTYYIDGQTNIGLYVLNKNNDVALIDCGPQFEGPIIDSLLRRHNFHLTHLILTHSHADHSGCALYLYKITGCMIISSKIERAFMRDAKLDIGFLYGGYPLNEYDSKLMHVDDNDEIYSLKSIPDGLTYFYLPGHHYGMIGIKTADGVNFVADTLGNIDLVDTQKVLLIYDVSGYLNTLDYVESLNGSIIVPSHSEVTTNISEVVNFNRHQIFEIMRLLLDYLKEEHTIEDVCKYIFDYYNLRISYNKYMIIMSTIRSYLSYLSNNKKLKNYFKNNKLVFILTESFIDKF